MNDDEIRDLLNQAFVYYDREAETYKDSTHAVLKFSAFYEELDEEDRPFADEVMVEWALSDDEKRRFQALSVIRDYSIASALPALRKLADRFEHSNEPGAPTGWAKVNRLIGHLVEGRSGDGGEGLR